MFSSKSLNILQIFNLNPCYLHQFGFEALFDCMLHKVRMQGAVLFANLVANFSVLIASTCMHW